MSAPVIDSDTPFSKGRANSHHTYSIGSPDNALKQYRAQIADDMAHAAVLAEVNDFCDKYFPVPSNPDKPKPHLEDPFAKLRELKKVKGNEAEIRAEFVSGRSLLPLLTFSQPYLILRCRQRLSLLMISFLASSSANVESGQTASPLTHTGRKSMLHGITLATPRQTGPRTGAIK